MRALLLHYKNLHFHKAKKLVLHGKLGNFETDKLWFSGVFAK